MNYQRHYDRLIERARSRLLGGYVESHHIIPKCVGGTNDVVNIVRLTPEEHFVAHVLLVKIYPETDGLVRAAHLLAKRGKQLGLRGNKAYGWLRREYARVVSAAMSGRIVSEETRRKIGRSKVGKQYSLGLTRSAETRRKISESKRGKTTRLLGKPKTESHRRALSKPRSEAYKAKMKETWAAPDRREWARNARLGKIVSEEQKRKQSLAMKGRPSPRKGIPMSEASKEKLRETKYRRAKEAMEWALFY